MGSNCWQKSLYRLTELQLHQPHLPIKMFFFVLALASTTLAAPQLPAGLTAAACPNYPYCDATTGFLSVPDVPGAADVIRAQEAIIRGNLAPTAGLPGIQAHAAAEAAVLLQQGRAPANLNAGELAHFQAEQAVRAAEQNLIVQGLQGQIVGRIMHNWLISYSLDTE